MLHPLTAIVLCLALALYVVVTINVGRARARYKVEAPATTGDPAFERAFRVQQNTLESLVIFVPVLWMFSVLVSPLWGAAAGAVWILGRALYAQAYYADAARRGPGFIIAYAATGVLLIGAFGGAVTALLRTA